MQAKKRVTIFGASGCNNVGDDLLGVTLQALLQKQLGPHVDVVLAPQHIREHIEQSDAVVIGGGGLIYDYDFANVENYVGIIERAAAQQIAVYMMGMGVQHVFSDKAKQLYRRGLRHVQAITVRDDDEKAFFVDELRCRPEQIIISRDLAFLAPDMFGWPQRPVPHEKKRLLLSIADWKLSKTNYDKIEKGLSEQYASFVAYLHKEIGTLAALYDITLVCQAVEDQELYKDLQAKHGLELITFDTIDASKTLLEVYAQSDLVITGRYHGLIAAVLADKPVICVSFGGHKQQKLINDSFPSLREQFYSVDTFTKQDVLGGLRDAESWGRIAKVSDGERKYCVKLARRNYIVAKMIAGELAKFL